MPKRLPPVGFYGIALAIAALDQLVKALVVRNLPVGTSGSIPLWPGVFHLTHVQNPGIAFSLLEGKLPIITGAAFIVMGVLIATERRAAGKLALAYGIALALPLGGAIGNLIDRLRQGYVTDFLDFRLINFPVFNVADSAITIGILLLAWRTLRTPEPPRAPREIGEASA